MKKGHIFIPCTVAVPDPVLAEKLAKVAPYLELVKLRVDVEASAELEVILEPVEVLDNGCPGWLGSVELVKADPNLSWASVESMTVMSQSQLSLSVASIISWSETASL